MSVRAAHDSQYLAAVLSAMDHPVLICRPDGTVQQNNQAAAQLALQLWDEVPWPARRFDQSFGEPEAFRLASGHVAAAAGHPGECEVAVLDRRGVVHNLSIRWRPVEPEPGVITSVCVTVLNISTRRNAEQTLSVLQRALDAIAEGVVIADLDQRAIYYNRAFGVLAGNDPAGAPSLAHLLGQEANRELRAAVRHQLQAVQPFAGEVEGTGRNGEPYWHEISVIPLLNDQGGPTHFVGVRGDVTARKQMERSLEESRSRLQAVITTAMDGIVSFDESQRIVLINRAAAAMFGLTEAEALGRPIEDLIPQLFGAARTERAGDSTTGGRLGEMLGRRAGGEEFPIEVSISQVQVQGRLLFTAIARDISARREAESVLQASQRRFKSIFEHSIDGILLADDSGNYVDANPAACQLLGRERSAVLQLNIRDASGLPSGQPLEQEWQELLRTGSAHGEMHLRRPDGSSVLVEFSAIADILRGLHLVLLRDVTERRALQDQLLRQQRLDSVGRLASGLAHDLNNILTPILMVPGMLRGRLQDPASLGLLDVLEQGARRGAAIIEQLLTFARERPGERKVQHLGAVVESSARIIRETFPKNIGFDLNLDAQAWPFMGDATQLQQLILNLAMNARDAMKTGGKLTIAVTNEVVAAEEARQTPGAKPGPYVVLSVVDTGYGIEAAHLERIFDPFFTTKALGEGTGLGLSAALGIARHHGGFITVRSRPRHGATFRVYLPAVGVEAPPTASLMGPLPPRSGQGEVVLVVDDEEDLRLIARQLLSQHGYSVICAKDGESALAQLKAADHRIDLVLTDLAMPGMGGDRLIALLRRRNPELRIIVMTGHDANGVVEPNRTPVHGYLRKPFSGDDLLHALATLRAAATG
jgi:two-component system, cell cycle sensor histidine kinase and response regulator CckA